MKLAQNIYAVEDKLRRAALSNTALFFISTLFGLALWKTPLLFDEVFGVFFISQNLALNPENIWTTALGASAQGWSQGRFISPVLHLFGNFGFALNFWTSELFNLDPLTSYGLWRAILIGATTVLLRIYIFSLLNGTLSRRALLSISALAAYLVPSLLISNRLFSSPRSAPWAYTGALIILLALLICMAKLAKKDYSQRGSQGHVILGLSILGFLFGTTYELTQLMAPVAILTFILVRDSNRPGLLRYPVLDKKDKAHISAFLIFYLAPFLIIRIDSYFKCLKGCYAPANIKLDSFSPERAINRFISANPVTAGTQGFLENFGQERFSEFFFSSVFIGILIFPILWVLFRDIQKTANNNQRLLQKTSINLVFLGLTIMLLVSVGMAFSQEVQSNPLPMGASTRDTLYQAFGLAIFCLGALTAIILLAFKKKWVVSGVAIILAAGFSLSAGTSFTLNSELSKTGMSADGKYILERFAVESTSINLSEAGDQIRCELVRLKLRDFPEWEGHDRLLMAGLNERMVHRFGVKFCSLSEEELFINYGR